MPGYHSVLPRVFPYRVRCDVETAIGLIDVLLSNFDGGFALTSHPTSYDGHVHLWLSTENAEHLIAIDVLQSRRLEKTE